MFQTTNQIIYIYIYIYSVKQVINHQQFDRFNGIVNICKPYMGGLVLLY